MGGQEEGAEQAHGRGGGLTKGRLFGPSHPSYIPSYRSVCLHLPCSTCRDQATSDNPPMLLPCNHVLCEQSVLKIAKSRGRVFKCPYCPQEARADNLRPLTFPDLA